MSSPKIQFHASAEAATQPLSSSSIWQIKLLYDGECPLCLREVNFLRKQDASRGLVAFVDIADDNYTPEENGGVDFETAMGRIHALLPDGTVIKNVAALRRIYEILGIGWIYAATQWPVIGPIVDWLYEIWADWRLALTRRPDLATITRSRREAIAAKSQQRMECKTQGRCELADDQ